MLVYPASPTLSASAAAPLSGETQRGCEDDGAAIPAESAEANLASTAVLASTELVNDSVAMTGGIATMCPSVNADVHPDIAVSVQVTHRAPNCQSLPTSRTITAIHLNLSDVNSLQPAFGSPGSAGLHHNGEENEDGNNASHHMIEGVSDQWAESFDNSRLSDQATIKVEKVEELAADGSGVSPASTRYSAMPTASRRFPTILKQFAKVPHYIAEDAEEPVPLSGSRSGGGGVNGTSGRSGIATGGGSSTVADEPVGVPGVLAEGVRRAALYWRPRSSVKSSLFPDEPLVNPATGEPSTAVYKLQSVVNWGRTSLVYKAHREVNGTIQKNKLYALKFLWLKSDLEDLTIPDIRPISSCSLPEPRRSREGFRQARGLYGKERQLAADYDSIKSEAEILQLCADIPHVARLREILYVRRHVILAMDFIPGALHRFAAETQGIGIDMATCWCRQLVKTLHKCHNLTDSVSVVHGDIKSENVLIDRDGQVQLIDFGAAMVLPKNVAMETAKSGVYFGGTATHCPPESVDFVKRCYLGCDGPYAGLAGWNSDVPEESFAYEKGPPHGWNCGELDETTSCVIGASQQAATDIWCVGLVVLELLIGDVPFSALCHDDTVPAMGKTLDIVTSAEYLECLWVELDGHLDKDALDFVKACLRADPAERATTAELVEHPFLHNPGRREPASLREAFSMIEHHKFSVSALTGSILGMKPRRPDEPTTEVYRQSAARFWATRFGPEPSTGTAEDPTEQGLGGLGGLKAGALKPVHKLMELLVSHSPIFSPTRQIGKIKRKRSAVSAEELPAGDSCGVPPAMDGLSPKKVYAAEIVRRGTDPDLGVITAGAATRTRLDDRRAWLTRNTPERPDPSPLPAVVSKFQRGLSSPLMALRRLQQRSRGGGGEHRHAAAERQEGPDAAVPVELREDDHPAITRRNNGSITEVRPVSDELGDAGCEREQPCDKRDGVGDIEQETGFDPQLSPLRVYEPSGSRRRGRTGGQQRLVSSRDYIHSPSSWLFGFGNLTDAPSYPKVEEFRYRGSQSERNPEPRARWNRAVGLSSSYPAEEIKQIIEVPHTTPAVVPLPAGKEQFGAAHGPLEIADHFSMESELRPSTPSVQASSERHTLSPAIAEEPQSENTAAGIVGRSLQLTSYSARIFGVPCSTSANLDSVSQHEVKVFGISREQAPAAEDNAVRDRPFPDQNEERSHSAISTAEPAPSGTNPVRTGIVSFIYESFGALRRLASITPRVSGGSYQPAAPSPSDLAITSEGNPKEDGSIETEILKICVPACVRRSSGSRKSRDSSETIRRALHDPSNGITPALPSNSGPMDALESEPVTKGRPHAVSSTAVGQLMFTRGEQARELVEEISRPYEGPLLEAGSTAMEAQRKMVAVNLGIERSPVKSPRRLDINRSLRESRGSPRRREAAFNELLDIEVYNAAPLPIDRPHATAIRDNIVAVSPSNAQPLRDGQSSVVWGSQ